MQNIIKKDKNSVIMLLLSDLGVANFAESGIKEKIYLQNGCRYNKLRRLTLLVKIPKL